MSKKTSLPILPKSIRNRGKTESAQFSAPNARNAYSTIGIPNTTKVSGSRKEDAVTDSGLKIEESDFEGHRDFFEGLTDVEEKDDIHMAAKGITWDDVLSSKALMYLNHVFKNNSTRVNEKGQDVLNYEQFERAIKSLSSDKKSKHLDLHKIFLKIDTTFTNTVNWEQFLSYLLLEYKERDIVRKMIRSLPYPRPARIVRESTRVGNYVSFSHVPFDMDSSPMESLLMGQYLAVNENGSIDFWTMDLKTSSGSRVDLGVGELILTAQYLKTTGHLVLSTTGMQILFYTFHMSHYYISVRIINTPFIVSMVATGNSILLGTNEGDVDVMTFAKDSHDLHEKGVVMGSTTVLTYDNLREGKKTGVTLYRHHQVHTNAIQAMMVLRYDKLFISSCTDANCALCISPVEQRSDVKRRYHRITKGIMCFDIYPDSETIATGGMDQTVKIWELRIEQKAMANLPGHTRPVSLVKFNKKSQCLVSMSTNRMMKVWDLLDHSCLQTILCDQPQFGNIDKRMSILFINPVQNTMIVGSTTLAIFEPHTEYLQKRLKSHEGRIVSVLYNPLYHLLVSASNLSDCKVWNPETGEMVIYFDRMHQQYINGRLKVIETTAILFDQSLRRLISGSSTGQVRTWNFTTGECLRSFEPPHNDPRVGYIWTMSYGRYLNRKFIYVAGMTKYVRRIQVPKENELDAAPTEMFFDLHHKTTIVSLLHVNDRIMVTGSFDGDICVWDAIEGMMTFKLNVIYHKTPKEPKSEYEHHRAEDPGKNVVAKSTSLVVNAGRSLSRNKLAGASSEHFIPDSTYSEVLKEKVETRHATFKVSSGSFMKIDRATTEHSQTVSQKVTSMLLLESRSISDTKEASLITAGSDDGKAHFWSLARYRGGLRGFIKVLHADFLGKMAVTAMDTDGNNNYLFTGDTLGYIKVWHISNFLTSQRRPSNKSGEFRPKMFPFVKMVKDLQADQSSKNWQWLKSRIVEGNPPLLNYFQGHRSTIVSLQYLSKRQLIATAANDLTVRLWTVTGRHIGIFGHRNRWEIYPLGLDTVPIDEAKIANRIPEDLVASVSDASLYVMAGGKNNLWKKLHYMKERFEAEVHRGQKDKKQISSVIGMKLEDIKKSAAITRPSRLGKVTIKRLKQDMPKSVIRRAKIDLEQENKPQVWWGNMFPAYHLLPLAEMESVKPVLKSLKPKPIIAPEQLLDEQVKAEDREPIILDMKEDTDVTPINVAQIGVGSKKVPTESASGYVKHGKKVGLGQIAGKPEKSTMMSKVQWDSESAHEMIAAMQANLIKKFDDTRAMIKKLIPMNKSNAYQSQLKKE